MVNKKVERVLTIVLILAIVLAVIGYILSIKNNANSFIPDYASGVIDVNAIKKEDSDQNKKNNEAGSGKVNLQFSNTVLVEKSKKEAQLYFMNPSTSTKNVMLYLLIRQNNEELVLGNSDVVPPGYAIYKINLNNISGLKEGGYKGVLKTAFYDEKSNAKEIIDSEIEVSIEVK